MAADEPGTPGRVRSDGGPVVAVDGPGGSGKSTVSRALARRAGLRYLDTGAMYRAVAYEALRRGVDVHDPDAVAALAEGLRWTVPTGWDARGLDVDSRHLEGQLRTDEVTAAVSAVAAVPRVRSRLVAEQRRIMADGAIVAEGRDIGTVVAPRADVKVYLTASSGERARRRAGEHAGGAAPRDDTVARTQALLDRRDALDSGRGDSPLSCAPDALVIDSTCLSVEEVVDRILAALDRDSRPPAAVRTGP